MSNTVKELNRAKPWNRIRGLGVLVLFFVLVLLFMSPATFLNAGTLDESDRSAIVGRWDITIHSSKADYPSWLEVRRSGSQNLVGQFVGRSGSARPISRVEVSAGQLRFTVPLQWERRQFDLYFEGKLQDGGLTGWTTDDAGGLVNWTAKRAPTLRRAAEPEWGTPIPLCSGAGLSGWHSRGSLNQWRLASGVLSNAKAGGNLITDRTFTDFKLHLEFRYPKGGNSGVYLRGRYEVQIEDSTGMEPASDHLGGIYGFLAPNEDAAKKAGEWQAFDVTLIGRMVTVVLNGKTVICNQEIPGITGGALDSDEATAGPLLLQGDHGPVDFRDVTITPAK